MCDSGLGGQRGAPPRAGDARAALADIACPRSHSGQGEAATASAVAAAGRYLPASLANSARKDCSVSGLPLNMSSGICAYFSMLA